MDTSPRERRLVADGAVGIAEACRFTGLGRTTLYAMMERGELSYVKVPGTRRRLVPRSELTRILATGLVAASNGGEVQ